MTSCWARWRLKSPASRLFVNHLFRRRSKKTSKLHVTGLCAGNLPVTGEFSAQMVSNAENAFDDVIMFLRFYHRVVNVTDTPPCCVHQHFVAWLLWSSFSSQTEQKSICHRGYHVSSLPVGHGVSSRRSLRELLSWCHVFKSSHCISFKDRLSDRQISRSDLTIW